LRRGDDDLPEAERSGPPLAIAAALASAAGAYFGTTVVGSGKDLGWAQARATAEAIKSECFRYTSRAGAYSQPNAAKTCLDRIDTFARTATDAGLALSNDPIPAKGDERMPVDPMAPGPEDEGAAKGWYVTHRIDEQIGYYRKGQEKNEALASQLWWVAFRRPRGGAVWRDRRLRPGLCAVDRLVDDHRRGGRCLWPMPTTISSTWRTTIDDCAR